MLFFFSLPSDTQADAEPNQAKSRKFAQKTPKEQVKAKPEKPKKKNKKEEVLKREAIVKAAQLQAQEYFKVQSEEPNYNKEVKSTSESPPILESTSQGTTDPSQIVVQRTVQNTCLHLTSTKSPAGGKLNDVSSLSSSVALNVNTNARSPVEMQQRDISSSFPNCATSSATIASGIKSSSAGVAISHPSMQTFTISNASQPPNFQHMQYQIPPKHLYPGYGYPAQHLLSSSPQYFQFSNSSHIMNHCGQSSF